MPHKIAFILSSCDKKMPDGHRTGTYLSELAHLFIPLHSFTHDVVIVTPEGKIPVLDESSVSQWKEDPDCKQFIEHFWYTDMFQRPKKPDEVNVDEIDCIVIPGGHGPMWDLSNTPSVQHFIAKATQHALIVAVCHGVVALVNVQLDGKWWVRGKRLTGFSNQEERAVHLEDVVPFLLEHELVKRDAIYSKSPEWQEHVVEFDNLLTGQNPNSSKRLAQRAIETLKSRHVRSIRRLRED